MSECFDVIIVGAGLSGLCAARTLKKQNKKILILDQLNRTGGRIYTKQVDSYYNLQYDMGANWIMPEQTRVYALAEELQLEISNQPNFGQALLGHTITKGGKQDNIIYIAIIITIFNYIFTFISLINWIILMISLLFLYLALPGGKQKYKIQTFDTFPTFGASKVLQLQQIQADLDNLAFNINAEYPWLSPAAHELDSLSLEEWAQKNIKEEDIYKTFQAAVDCVFGIQMNSISLLYVLYIIKTTGSVENLVNARTGNMQDRFVGGSQQLIKKIEQELSSCLKILDSKVTEIDDRKDYVYIKTEQKKSYKCKKVIVAMPPHSASRIKYNNTMPQERLEYLQQFAPNGVSRCCIFFDKPFWRRQKLNGLIICPEDNVKMFYDGSPDTLNQNYGVLVGQMSYYQFYKQNSYTQRKNQVINLVKKLFKDQAMFAINYTDESFYEDIYINGNSCHLNKGIITKYRINLRENVGNIYWASSEYSHQWNGFMEGAIESGIRAAEEIIN